MGAGTYEGHLIAKGPAEIQGFGYPKYTTKTLLDAVPTADLQPGEFRTAGDINFWWDGDKWTHGGPWVDVRAYGASASRTDNEVPINAAIQDLPVAGGFIFIPIWFEVSGPILVDSDAITLVGLGWFDFPSSAGLPTIGSGLYAGNSFVGTEVVRYESSNPDGRPVLGGGMRDMMVVGTSLNASPTANVIGIVGKVARANFDRVYTTRCTSHGLVLQGAAIALGDGIDWSTYDTSITNCQSSHNDGSGMYLGSASADVKINNVQCFNNVLDGIVAYGASHQINQGHVYENRYGVYVGGVRMRLVGIKVEDSRQHGVYAESIAASSQFVGGLLITGGCGFRNNGTDTANTYDDVFIDADQSDGSWHVTSNYFMQDGSTPRYAINMSTQMTQGLIAANTVEGTYGTDVVNQTNLNIAAGAFANKQIANAVGFNDPAIGGGGGTPPVVFNFTADGTVGPFDNASNAFVHNLGTSTPTIQLFTNSQLIMDGWVANIGDSNEIESIEFSTNPPANGETITFKVSV